MADGADFSDRMICALRSFHSRTDDYTWVLGLACRDICQYIKSFLLK